ncbi:MAG: ABC transporter ATP-binding protein [Hyphomicrobiaceae bacterium]
MSAAVTNEPPLLEVRNLSTRFRMGAVDMLAVRRVDLEVARREVLGIIGESGSGKSVTGLSLLRLLPAHAKVAAEYLRFAGRELLPLDDEAFRQLRGTHLAMIFQDPVGAFNPAKSIGWHLDRIIARAATREDRQGIDLTQDAHRWLTDVGIAHPERILPLYPHQLSGGMLQRTLIALSAALQPDLLIADEPTTNLDNIVERQIIGLFRRLKDKLGSAIIFITHDIALAAGLCDRIAVMYAGEIVETGPADVLFRSPAHPYTAGLIETSRQLDERAGRLKEIPGELPSGLQLSQGCLFAPRCGFATDACLAAPPANIAMAKNHSVRCIRHA